jgi:hypothetical protein
MSTTYRRRTAARVISTARRPWRRRGTHISGGSCAPRGSPPARRRAPRRYLRRSCAADLNNRRMWCFPAPSLARCASGSTAGAQCCAVTQAVGGWPAAAPRCQTQAAAHIPEGQDPTPVGRGQPGGAFRPRAVDQAFQQLHRRLEVGDLDGLNQGERGQFVSILRQVLRPKQHAEDYRASMLFPIKNKDFSRL